MAAWIAASPGAQAIDALAQAMLRAGYVAAGTQDEFHARAAAAALIQELRTLGYAVTPIAAKHDERGQGEVAH